MAAGESGMVGARGAEGGQAEGVETGPGIPAFEDFERTEASDHQADVDAQAAAAMRQPLPPAEVGSDGARQRSALGDETGEPGDDADDGDGPDGADAGSGGAGIGAEGGLDAGARAARARQNAFYRTTLSAPNREELAADTGPALEEAARIIGESKSLEAEAIIEEFRLRMAGEGRDMLVAIREELGMADQVEVFKKLIESKLTPSDHLVQAFIFGKRLMALSEALGSSSQAGVDRLLRLVAQHLGEEAMRASAAVNRQLTETADRAIEAIEAAASSSQQMLSITIKEFSDASAGLAVREAAVAQAERALAEKTANLLPDMEAALKKVFQGPGAAAAAAVVNEAMQKEWPRLLKTAENSLELARQDVVGKLSADIQAPVASLGAVCDRADKTATALVAASKESTISVASHKNAIEETARHLAENVVNGGNQIKADAAFAAQMIKQATSGSIGRALMLVGGGSGLTLLALAIAGHLR